MPEFAPALTDLEQEMVDKMQATVDNAQAAALRRRSWDEESVGLFKSRLQATVQASLVSTESSQGVPTYAAMTM